MYIVYYMYNVSGTVKGEGLVGLLGLFSTASDGVQTQDKINAETLALKFVCICTYMTVHCTCTIIT